MLKYIWNRLKRNWCCFKHRPIVLVHSIFESACLWYLRKTIIKHKWNKFDKFMFKYIWNPGESKLRRMR